MSIAKPSLSDINKLEVNSASSLTVMMDADFGYLPPTKVIGTQVSSEKFKADIDDATIEALKKYVSNKVPVTDSSTSAAANVSGRNNPFSTN